MLMFFKRYEMPSVAGGQVVGGGSRRAFQIRQGRAPVNYLLLPIGQRDPARVSGRMEHSVWTQPPVGGQVAGQPGGVRAGAPLDAAAGYPAWLG